MSGMTLEHPVEARVYHWLHLVSMLILIFTGFFIHYPFFKGSMATMRFLHFVSMYVLIFTLIMRVSYAFLSRRRDFRNFGLGWNTWKNLPAQIMYYLFLRKNPPEGVSGYNPPQRLAYVFFAPLIVVQAMTGFALYTPTQKYFEWLTAFLGGLEMVRVWHFAIMWVFILVLAIHIYLSVMEYDQFKYMILSMEPKELKE